MLLVLCPTSVWASPPVWGDCGGGASGDLESLNRALRDLVAQGDDAAAQCVQHRVGRGLPPAALLGLLDAIELDHPEGMVAVAWDLARHRRSSVRSRALHVLAGYGGEWTRRAVTLALADRDPQVRGAGFDLASMYPASSYTSTLLGAFREGDARATAALAACAEQQHVVRLVGSRSEVPEAAWVGLIGALLRREGFLTPIQRLGLVSTLAAMRTAESQDELRQFLRSEVGARPPQARNVAARALGMRQAPPLEKKQADGVTVAAQGGGS